MQTYDQSVTVEMCASTLSSTQEITSDWISTHRPFLIFSNSTAPTEHTPLRNMLSYKLSPTPQGETDALHRGELALLQLTQSLN